MELGLKGKVALVTAASRGLGYAVASALAREQAAVAISARNPANLARAAEKIRSAGGNVFDCPADLVDRTAVEQMLDHVLEHYGRVDILVCNTGGPPATTFAETTVRDWEAALEMLFFPVVQLVQRVLPGMRERRDGRIIFMTSTWVKQPRERSVLSTAVRNAISGLSKQLATELAPDNVLINQVMPGPTWTDRSKEITRHLAEARGVAAQEIKAQIVREVPLGRYGLPEEIADAIVFLVSERAGFITGASLQVDGGQIRATL